MRPHIVFFLAAFAVAASIASACGERSGDRLYRLQGQVLSVDPSGTRAQIKHEEIEGLMPAMTMPYEVRDAKLLEGLAPGDLINATLVIESNGAYLSAVNKVGSAPLEASADAPSAFASSGFELLKPGEAAPEAHFIDQDGRERDFKSFRGQPVVVTFMYTKCPMPTFCPFLDRNFAAVQKALESNSSYAALKGNVRLASISFDPLTDTPAVLKQHAAKLNADPRVWTFLTGDRDEVDRFAARFGVMIARSTTEPLDITHNLRTSIIDADGKLVTTFTGNEWTPEQLLAELKTIAAN